MTDPLDGWKDILAELGDGEVVEAVVFGEQPLVADLIPEPMRGVPLSPDQAQPLMRGWSFDGDYGTEECPAAYVWTDRAVLIVRAYDGLTELVRIPLKPTPCHPDYVGGG